MEDTSRSQPISTQLQQIAEQARRHPEYTLGTLAHLMDVEWLREAYHRTRKDSAPGIDEVTARDYAAHLDENLQALHRRLAEGEYRATPVKRVWLEKEDGRLRPIGIPAFEDKIVQRAVVMLMSAAYGLSAYPCGILADHANRKRQLCAGSTVDGDDLENLEAGAHDPNNNGFTLQQAELSLAGAVDPYLRAEGHVVATPDDVELEEAFATTAALPAGFQLEAGYFLTEFGILNPRHAHSWDWMDQPFVLTRLMGDEALRSPGARLGWLTPLPWYSELNLGVQNADEGDLTASFIGDGALGRPSVDRDINGPEDLLWLLRWVNSFDPGTETTIVWGLSGLYGPNDTSNTADTWIYGTDLKVRWRPRSNFRGWPFVLWQTEIVGRSYDAAASSEPDGPTLPSDTLEDYGGYTQVLWGFRPGWATGLRYEYGSASGDSTIDDALVSHDDDPFRDERHRVSPLLVWHLTHFSRLRLQYNYDRAKHLDDNDAHTVWLGLEILYGQHGAHEY